MAIVTYIPLSEADIKRWMEICNDALKSPRVSPYERDFIHGRLAYLSAPSPYPKEATEKQIALLARIEEKIYAVG